MPDVLVQGPLSEPVSLEAAKAQLRVTHALEDVLIKGYIKAARARIESREATGQVFVRQGRRAILDRFPLGRAIIELVRGPVRSIDSITYVDDDGNTQTWDSSKYEFLLMDRFTQIRPVSGESYPSTKDTLGAVSVNYTAGHMVSFTVDDSTDILTAAGHGKVDGDIVSLRNSGGALPDPLSEDTNYYVITATTDTLQLSLTSGGGAVDIAAAGTGLSYIGVGESDLNTAMLLIMANLWENRSEVITGTIATEMPSSVSDLCEQHAFVRR